MPDPEDRAGARIFAEEEEQEVKKSRASWYVNKSVRGGGDLADAAKGAGKYAQQGVILRPTGQATQKPTGPAISAVKTPFGAPDLVAAIAIMAVVATHLAGSAIKEWRRGKGGNSGNNR